MAYDDANNKSTLPNLFEDLARSDTTLALERLGRMLSAIPVMSAREVPVIWHLLSVCSSDAMSATSKRAVKALRHALWARMRQILSEEAGHEGWGHGDLSQIHEIVMTNQPPPKKTLWQRLKAVA